MQWKDTSSPLVKPNLQVHRGFKAFYHMTLLSIYFSNAVCIFILSWKIEKCPKVTKRNYKFVFLVKITLQEWRRPHAGTHEQPQHQSWRGLRSSVKWRKWYEIHLVCPKFKLCLHFGNLYIYFSDKLWNTLFFVGVE